VIGMAKGMLTTLRLMLDGAVTVQYPKVKRVLPERSRSSFALPLGEDGTPLCKACTLCAKSCPNSAITMETAKREDGPGRVLTQFEIDLGLCMYCGICVENCPSNGLRHTGDYENASAQREDMTLVLFQGTGTVPLEGPPTGDGDDE
jgi:NADH-quinone oxidoreductase subunit I